MTGLAQITKNQPRGKPFPKGVSGNPGGRPRRTLEEIQLEEACRQKTPEALAVVFSLMREAKNERVKLAAAQIVLERGWGKARERVELSPMEVVVSRDISPEQGYLMMLEGGRLEALPEDLPGA